MDGGFEALVAALLRAGWFDRQPEPDHPVLAAIASPTADGFGGLRDYWRALSHSCASRSTSQRWASLAGWADAQSRNGSQLGWVATGLHAADLGRAIPLASLNATGTSYACRLIYWPRGLPPDNRSWSAAVSSRIGRRGFENRQWIAALRDACLRIQGRGLLVAAQGGTIGESIACAAAQLYALDLLLIQDSKTGRELRNWLRKLKNGSFQRLGHPYEAWISPSVDTACEISNGTAPLRDQLIFDWCDDIYVLHVRAGGNIERLIRRSLDERPLTRRIYLAADSSLVPSNLLAEFVERGAIPWTPQQYDSVEPELPLSDVPASGNGRPHDDVATVADEALCGDSWCYLSHCTRAQFGPWPGQSEHDFFCELLSSDSLATRTAMTSLARIVRERVLRAQGRGIRGGTPVVCFSEVPLLELMKMRAFQPHRGRWDFEPYGICIRRDWLTEHGCKPVVYGTNQDWEKLAPADRPFFQRSTTSTSRHSGQIDWTREREWRHVGDIDLQDLPHDAGFFFTRTASDAYQLAKISPWPVLPLDAYLAKATEIGTVTAEASAPWSEPSRRRSNRATPKTESR